MVGDIGKNTLNTYMYSQLVNGNEFTCCLFQCIWFWNGSMVHLIVLTFDHLKSIVDVIKEVLCCLPYVPEALRNFTNGR